MLRQRDCTNCRITTMTELENRVGTSGGVECSAVEGAYAGDFTGKQRRTRRSQPEEKINMKTYLVEEYSQEIAFENNSLIIALTPKAAYQLDKLGITYSIIEDYYSETELLSEKYDYFTFASQLNWIEEFDKYLQEKIPQLRKLDLKLCYWYFYFFKTMIDPLIVRSNILNRFFEKIKPSEVVYITAHTEEIVPDFKLIFGKGKSIYLRLLPLFCEKHSASFTCTNVAEEPTVTAIGDTTSTDTWVARKLKDFVRSNDALLNLYRSYRSGCWYNAVPHLSMHKQLNILMLKLGYGGDLFIKDALKRGHNVFLKSEDTIYNYTLFGLKKYYKLKNSESFVNPEYKEIWQTTANQLINQPEILGWINDKCGVDVSEIILPRLQYFISSICPEILGYFYDYINFYNKNDIDFVITPHETSPDEIAAIAAARYSKKTKSICFLHGSGVYALDMWDITEIDHHDIYFALYEEIKEYFIKRKNMYAGQRTEIFQGFGLYLFSNHLKIKEKREKGIVAKSNKKNRPKIIYLPTIFMWDHQRIDDAGYSDAWYYMFQKALIEHFSTMSEFEFVWKGLPASDSIYNPIPNFIKDNQFENIEIATDYFGSHLISADRVIADFPSTGFYEAVVAGVPAMTLYHRDFKVRKSAIEFFGLLVQPFSDIPEALEKIDRFLESDPKLYCTSIPLTNNALKVLEALNQAKQDV